MSDTVRRRRHARRSESQWVALFAEQSRSGVSQRAFCDSRGIGYSTYDKAKRRYQCDLGSGPQSLERDFVSLTRESTTPERWEVELSVGSGVVIRIRGA